MTVEEFDETATDAEEFFIAWLLPLGGAGIRIDDDTVLPFRYVHMIDGVDDCNLFTRRAVVSVRTMCDASGQDPAVYTSAAKAEADSTHSRILYLVRHADTVVALPSGRQATVDYCDVMQIPEWIDYDNDQTLCKVGTYEVGFTFVADSP